MSRIIVSNDFPAEEEIGVSEFSITYTQHPDSCSSTDEFQELVIKTEDAGGGKFLVLETKRWAINDASELADVIEDFYARLNYKKE
jgi:hypothetical protein